MASFQVILEVDPAQDETPKLVAMLQGAVLLASVQQFQDQLYLWHQAPITVNCRMLKVQKALVQVQFDLGFHGYCYSFRTRVASLLKNSSCFAGSTHSQTSSFSP